MSRKRALIVGINHYVRDYIGNLQNAINDARVVADILSQHDPQTPGGRAVKNYDCEVLLGDNTQMVTRKMFHQKLRWLFEGSHDGALLFFAGHAVRSKLDDMDYLVTSDATDDNYGVSLQFLSRLANNAYPRIRSSTLILDCCHSGALGTLPTSDYISEIGTGVTILSASEYFETASDQGSRPAHGAFTSLLLDALEGQATDILGRVTPASVYALIDARLGAREQRPVYKSNVNEFIEIRKSTPKIYPHDLHNVTRIFETADENYTLDPEHERPSDRGQNFKTTFGELGFDNAKHKNYRLLQNYYKNGLVEVLAPQAEPSHWDALTNHALWPPEKGGGFSLWHAAIFGAQCRLTSKGRHYWNLVHKGHI